MLILKTCKLEKLQSRTQNSLRSVRLISSPWTSTVCPPLHSSELKMLNLCICIARAKSQKFLRKILRITSYTNSEDLTIPQIYKREREKLCNITFLGVQGDTQSHYTRLAHTHTHDRPLLPVYVIGKWYRIKFVIIFCWRELHVILPRNHNIINIWSLIRKMM